MISVKEEGSNGSYSVPKDKVPVGFSCNAESKTNDEDRHLVVKKKILYDIGADALCEFGNGESIRVNKSLLAFYSPVFAGIFFGESPSTNAKIEDFDFETFQTFLDCLFGFNKYSALDSLLIYPIAFKYDVKDCIETCRIFLYPFKMDENVCLTLNLATFYKDSELEDDIIRFLDLNYGFFNLLVNDNYRNLLEPLAISRIIKETQMNSFVWKMVYKWGEFYLKKLNKPNYPIRLLLEDSDILPKLSLKDFESASSILDFHKFSNKELLDPNEILNFLDDNAFCDKNIPSKSLWVEVKKGDQIVETVTLESLFIVLDKKMNVFEGKQILMCISTNTVYSAEDSEIIKCRVRYCSMDSVETSYSYRAAFDFLPITNGQTFKKFRLSIPVETNLEQFVISKFELTYKFLHDCTILKTSSNENDVWSEKLCFTRGVAYDRVVVRRPLLRLGEKK